MWHENKILLIDDNIVQREKTSVILEFLGEEQIVCDSQNWRSIVDQIANNQRVQAVLLGEIKAPLTLLDLVKALIDWDEFAPILLMGDKSVSDWPDRERKRILAQLELPLGYNKLNDSLHRAQVYRDMYDQARGRGLYQASNLFRSLVGNSRAIQHVRKMMQQVADTEASVLILGESGTGKEVVARNLHYHSKRRDAPFIPVNCGAIPAELLESELFGHEKGAFTGAISQRAGRFELANGGTLFLDEIGDMPLPMQVKLLRVLQEKTFERVGSNKTQTADVRIIAATHKNLEDMIAAGHFREDLYYRLNVFPIEMAPLRERAEDIPLLLSELISRMEHDKRGSIRFSSAAILSLCRHPWPGNVRELANLVERMAIMHPFGVIGVQELPKKFQHVEGQEIEIDEGLHESFNERAALNASVSATSFDTQMSMLPAEGLDLKEYLSSLEQGLIQQALDDAGGVVARAADRLRIRRTTLVEKMRKYGMSRRDEEDAFAD